MPSNHRIVRVYRELADWYERQGQASLRDRFLMLAADAAFAAGLKDEAERLRLRLLQLNPHHLLKPFASFAEAVQSGDVQDYLLDLRQNYPHMVAEQLLQSLAEDGVPAEPKTKLPSTVAVLDPSRAPGDQSANANEPLKVYRVLEAEDEPALSPPPPPPQPLPVPPQKPSSPPAAARPRPRSAQPLSSPLPVAAPPSRLRPSPLVPTRREPPPARTPAAGEPEAATGAWLSTALFVIVLMAGLGLAAYTLLGPLLRVL
jgi:hypothetical protein